MTSPCVLSALALASLPLPTFCNHVHKVSCHERARACIVTQLSCKNPARLTHLQRRDFAMHRAQLINTNISRISPESTPIQEGIDKEAGGAAEACQACAAGTPVHQAELGPAGTHFSGMLDRGAGCRSRWYMNHSGWLTGDNASRQKQPEIAIDDCRGSIGGAMRELAGGGD